MPPATPARIDAARVVDHAAGSRAHSHSPIVRHDHAVSPRTAPGPNPLRRDTDRVVAVPIPHAHQPRGRVATSPE